MTRGYAYKVLGPDREAWHGGSGRWAQRKRWMPLIKQVEPCMSGYHLCRDERQLLTWLGPSIWVAEYEGDVINSDDKIVVGRARLVDRVEAWDERTARLFAADCAERVVHLNPDQRVHAVIKAARLYAHGEIGRSELDAARAAARAAAWDAAGAAAWDAAGTAARAAAWDAAGAAAWAAAGTAAGTAAWDAARDAARDAAVAAAWAAARDAARDAAVAAAWAAARAAARAAAVAAARDAEREWQATRLREITGGLPA